MNRTYDDVAHLTPHEFVNMWHGYVWRRQQNENMIASLVTTWIANYAGKSSRKRVTIKDIFNDGRFDKHRSWTEEDQAMFDELYGGGE